MMDICNGSIFKSKEIFRNCPTALQIVAYYDDIVIVNQLSPRAKEQKLGTINNYCSDIITLHKCILYNNNIAGVIYYQLANLHGPCVQILP